MVFYNALIGVSHKFRCQVLADYFDSLNFRPSLPKGRKLGAKNTKHNRGYSSRKLSYTID